MANSFGLGIDLGGTKILAGVVDLDSGAVLSTAKKKTKASQGAEGLLARLGDLAEEALEKADLPEGSSVSSLGVAAAGQADPERGILLASPNLDGLRELPIGPVLGQRLGLPVQLGNDVQGAATGELRFGAGRGVDRLLCVFVGTGVGGAIIQGGKLESGATATAGEIGHTVIQADGRYCGCGGRGHLEAYASRTAITKVLLEELRRGRKSVLSDLLRQEHGEEGAPVGTALRSGIIAKAVAEKDELALETVHAAGRYLGLGLASAINLYNPHRIVLGGGVVEAMPMLVEIVAPIAKREALAAPGQAVEIVASELGDHAGIVGAALFGRD